MFVIFFGWNVSLIAGWFTLAFMVLPVVITASEESLKSVPKGFREGSLALGATKWQTIRKNVLPYALPGILTSSILGIARVAGETAPIMFTSAYVVRDKLPWDVERVGARGLRRQTRARRRGGRSNEGRGDGELRAEDGHTTARWIAAPGRAGAISCDPRGAAVTFSVAGGRATLSCRGRGSGSA